MFRTSLKTVSAVLAAAAVAAPVAVAGSPRTSTPGPAYSLGPALLQYRQHTGFFAQPRATAQGPAYSLGPALLQYRQHTGFFAQPTATAGGGFDWGDAAIGGGIVAGIFLLLLGAIAAVTGWPDQTSGRLRHT